MYWGTLIGLFFNISLTLLHKLVREVGITLHDLMYFKLFKTV